MRNMQRLTALWTVAEAEAIRGLSTFLESRVGGGETCSAFTQGDRGPGTNNGSPLSLYWKAAEQQVFLIFKPPRWSRWLHTLSQREFSLISQFTFRNSSYHPEISVSDLQRLLQRCQGLSIFASQKRWHCIAMVTCLDRSPIICNEELCLLLLGAWGTRVTLWRPVAEV